MRDLLFLLVVLFAGAVAMIGAGEKALVPVAQIPLATSLPPLGLPRYCDEDGTIYAATQTSDRIGDRLVDFRTSSVIRIDRDGNNPVPYSIAGAKLPDGSRISAFAPGSSGFLYTVVKGPPEHPDLPPVWPPQTEADKLKVLTETVSPKDVPQIVVLDAASKVVSQIVPSSVITAKYVAPFADGRLLIAGVERTADVRASHALVGVFSKAGKLIKRVDLPADFQPWVDGFPEYPPLAISAQRGPDGNVYLFSWKRSRSNSQVCVAYVIGSSGTVLRSFALEPPPEWHPGGSWYRSGIGPMLVTKGGLVATLYRMPVQVMNSSQDSYSAVAVFDPNDGSVREFYERRSWPSMLMACYDGKRFAFLGYDPNELKRGERRPYLVYAQPKN